MDTENVSLFLTNEGIKHNVSINTILVNRDSIVEKMCELHHLFGSKAPSPDENECYTMLRELLNNHFSGHRFSYAAKTDEWLMLEQIV